MALAGMGIYSGFTTFFTFFDISEIIVFATYLPVSPAQPVTSESGPLPMDYSNCGDNDS